MAGRRQALRGRLFNSAVLPPTKHDSRFVATATLSLSFLISNLQGFSRDPSWRWPRHFRKAVTRQSAVSDAPEQRISTPKARRQPNERDRQNLDFHKAPRVNAMD